VTGGVTERYYFIADTMATGLAEHQFFVLGQRGGVTPVFILFEKFPISVWNRGSTKSFQITINLQLGIGHTHIRSKDNTVLALAINLLRFEVFRKINLSF